MAASIAWIDATYLSTQYYHDHRPLIIQEFWLLLALAIIGVIVVTAHYHSSVWNWLDRKTHAWRVRAIWVALVLFFTVLISRPLWEIGYGANGARTFSEQTMNWIWWYIGPMLMLFGIIGLGWVAAHLVHGRKTELLAFMCVMLPPALLYLLQPNITGDQPWAVRRLLPVVLPGFVLLALLVFEALYHKKHHYIFGHKLDLRIIVASFGSLAIVAPVVISYPFMIRRLYVPQLSQIQSVCAAVPAGATVLWVGDSSNFAVQPTRAFCNVDSLGLAVPAAQTSEQLDQTLRTLSVNAKHTPLVIGVYHDQVGLLKGTARSTLTNPTITYADIEHSYKRVPRNTFLTDQTIYLGRLTSDGNLAAL